MHRFDYHYYADFEYDTKKCWQPKSSLFDPVKYEGKLSVSEQGFKCAAWNDQTMHPHKFSDVGSGVSTIFKS